MTNRLSAVGRRFVCGACAVLAVGGVACSSPPATVAREGFRASLVGDWLGTVGPDRETMSFSADGTFVAQLRPTGFIDSTLSEGVAGAVGGSWALEGNVIKLRIASAKNERLTNNATSATIETFQPNRIVIRSDKGITSAFERLRK